jgi:hypothetical protein
MVSAVGIDSAYAVSVAKRLSAVSHPAAYAILIARSPVTTA